MALHDHLLFLGTKCYTELEDWYCLSLGMFLALNSSKAKQELHRNREKEINEDSLLHLFCHPHLFFFSFRNNNLFLGPGIYKRNRETVQAEDVTTDDEPKLYSLLLLLSQVEAAQYGEKKKRIKMSVVKSILGRISKISVSTSRTHL